MSSSSKPRKSQNPSEGQKGAPSASPSASGADFSTPGADGAAASRPWTVSVTAAIMALEAVVVLYGALSFVMSLGAPGPLNVAGRIFLVVLMVVAAIFAATVAGKHFIGKAWTRSAVVVWQLFQVVLSGQYITGGAPVFGIVLLVPAAVALVLVFSPATRRFLEADDRPRG